VTTISASLVVASTGRDPKKARILWCVEAQSNASVHEVAATTLADD